MDILSILIGAIITAIPSTIVGIATKRINDNNKKIAEMQAREEGLRRGVQAILRDRLYQMYYHYKEKGYAPLYAKENFKNMYDQYHVLGQNGVMDTYVERFMAFEDEEE